MVAQAVSQHVAAAITSGGAGVEVGKFRAPTLRLTNRWISVSTLMAATIGTSLAAFVLARKAELVLRAPARVMAWPRSSRREPPLNRWLGT